MWKKLLDGLIFGLGFGLASFIVYTIGIVVVLPSILEQQFESKSTGSTRIDSHTTSVVPNINSPKRYLGSTGIYSGGFLNRDIVSLSSGPGLIKGNVLLNNKAVEGLKLRLALNGTAKSLWSTTDVDGNYTINVPYGKYAIDGFELSQQSADLHLPGKILHPNNPHSSGPFVVSDGNPGYGLNFKFVDPVNKLSMSSAFSSSEQITLKWSGYPGATEYKIQLYEKDEPHTWKRESLFNWVERPIVSEPQLTLKRSEVTLKPGKFYFFTVQALDETGRTISETAGNYSGFDFEITN